MVIEEVNGTDVPEHTLFNPAVMDTVGVTALFTTKVTALLVAVGVDTHPELLVITTVRTSPLAGDAKA